MIEHDNSAEIQKAADLIKKAKRIFVITGAGISADSGLPTYRGVSGLYNDETEDGMPIEMALAGETLREQPEITWKYLSQIEEKCRSASFNKAHEVLANFEKMADKVVILTQNIDGFHKAAGSTDVIDIHGDLHDLFCVDCGWSGKVSDFSVLNIPPICDKCGGRVRPDVVFFGELLPPGKTSRLYELIREPFDLYISIGTTSVFPYIQEPIHMAAATGLPVIEINPDDTEVSGLVDVRLRMKAAKALTAIWEKIA